MVDERLDDGVRIAQLLASEIEGNEGRLRDLTVTDADPDVEPTADGALAYAVRRTEDGPDDDAGRDEPPLAEVYVQSDRARVEFLAAPDAAAEAAAEEGLRVRPKAVRPPRTLVFVEDGAQVKWVLPVFKRVLAADESNPE
ncbi:hypothetical protein GCM10027435_07580 [Haloparvum alkalitolerans]|uniref:hypothetical protein n=1 Tax=Haloparvum alkalitolerans TaxID=1042953 RepID=UPI003CFA8532